MGDYAINVPQEHPEWAEILQAPEDEGELKNVLETKRDAMLLYVNPANNQVQGYQLKRADREVCNLGNILLNNKIDLIGSISLPDLKTAKELKDGFKATYDHSDGTMIFDLCYTDWSKLTPAMEG